MDMLGGDAASLAGVYALAKQSELHSEGDLRRYLVAILVYADCWSY